MIFRPTRTRDRLARLEAESGNVTVLYHEENRGKGRALRSGFGAARGDYVIIQDADLEYDPEDYAKLLHPLERGIADAVFGSRFTTTQGARACSIFGIRWGTSFLRCCRT